MPREIMFSTFAAAAAAGPYDERPMLPDSIDLQIHLSRNDRPQPFFLICQHDCVLVVMSGEGRVEFKDAPVLWHSYVPGDFLYVPAGTPHRIVPATESIQHRYKLPESELEAVAWYCEGCGKELYRDTWELAAEKAQAAYLRACTEFSADPARRTCSACGAVHPEIDLAPYHWAALAAA
jgi:hypothetical protein